MTPAYLLPKVGSFCLMTLKSMFKAALNNSNNSNNESPMTVPNLNSNKNKLLNGDVD